MQYVRITEDEKLLNVTVITPKKCSNRKITFLSLVLQTLCWSYYALIYASFCPSEIRMLTQDPGTFSLPLSLFSV